MAISTYFVKIGCAGQAHTAAIRIWEHIRWDGLGVTGNPGQWGKKLLWLNLPDQNEVKTSALPPR